MSEIVIILIRGLGYGAILALLAMASNVVFNASGILNFALAHVMIFAGVLAFLWLPNDAGAFVWFVMLFAVTAAAAALTAFQGWLTLLPLRSSVEQHSWIITTLAASIILGGIITVGLGPDPLVVSSPFGSFALYGTNVPYVYPLLIVLVLAVYLAMRWFLQGILSGVALNALSQDLDAARAAGASVRLLQIGAFGISGAIAGAAGYFGASVISISSASALGYLTFAFIAVLVGGVGNNLGAIVAGPIFGVFLMIVTYEAGEQLQIPIAVLVVVAVLMLRPEGLLGRPHLRRV